MRYLPVLLTIITILMAQPNSTAPTLAQADPVYDSTNPTYAPANSPTYDSTNDPNYDPANAPANQNTDRTNQPTNLPANSPTHNPTVDPAELTITPTQEPANRPGLRDFDLTNSEHAPHWQSTNSLLPACRYPGYMPLHIDGSFIDREGNHNELRLFHCLGNDDNIIVLDTLLLLGEEDDLFIIGRSGYPLDRIIMPQQTYKLLDGMVSFLAKADMSSLGDPQAPTVIPSDGLVFQDSAVLSWYGLRPDKVEIFFGDSLVYTAESPEMPLTIPEKHLENGREYTALFNGQQLVQSGFTVATQKQTKEIRTMLRDIDALGDEFKSVTSLLKSLHLSAANFQRDAEFAMREFCTASNNSPEATAILATFLMEQGRNEEALRVVETANFGDFRSCNLKGGRK